MRQLVDMLAEIVKIDLGRLSELTQAKARLLQAQTSQETVAALQLSVRKLVGDEPLMPVGTRWQLQLEDLDDAVAAVAQNPVCYCASKC